MNELSQWMELAQQIGVGGTFILGVACVFLWRTLRSEQDYLRVRDRETLDVVSNLTGVLDKQQLLNNDNMTRLLEGLSAIVRDIERHDKGQIDAIGKVQQSLEKLLDIARKTN